MRRKLIIDKYDPVIYPRMFWVTHDVIGLDKIFIFCNMRDGRTEELTAYNNLLEEYENGTGVLITCPVIHKATNKLGVLTIILQPDNIIAGDEAHEAVHVADYIFEQLGMYSQDFRDSNEQYAYLVGWAAGCISKSIIKNKAYDTRRESNDVEAGNGEL